MKPRHTVELKIILDTDGLLKVECNQMNDQLLLFGLLKQAELAIISHNIRRQIEKAQGSKIVTATDLLNRGSI